MSTYEMNASIEIAASPERIWSVLTDFQKFSRWNPFIRAVTGKLEAGSSLSIDIAPPGKRNMRFHPKVIEVQFNRRLRWQGKLIVPGMLDSEHYFDIECQNETDVTFSQGESFTGLLVPFVRSTLAATKIGFEKMNSALKLRAEQE